MTSDRIEIRGLRVLGHHGALAGEQDDAQPFEVDLDLACDLDAAAASDALADTVDYGHVVAAVAEVVASTRFALLEALADAIGDAVLADPRVDGVEVVVRKLRPPIAAHVATVGVRRHRSRHQRA